MKLEPVKSKIFDPVSRVPISFGDRRIQECIEYGGSKLGVALAVQSSFTPELEGLKKYLPVSHLQEPGETISSLQRKIDTRFQDDKFYVIRTCSPYDYSSLVGVFPYIRDNAGEEETDKENVLVRSLDTIEHFFAYNPNTYLAKHLGLDPSETDLELKLLIQEYIPEDILKGSIIEHPHRKDHFYIYLPSKGKQSTFLAPPKNNVREYAAYNRACTRWLEYFESIMTLYKEVKDAGLIPSGYTGEVSFKLDVSKNKLYLLQARIFRKKEKRASFDIDTKKSENIFISFDSTYMDGKGLPQDVFKDQLRKSKSKPFMAKGQETSGKELITHTSFGITPECGIEIDLADLLKEEGKASSENAKYYDYFAMDQWRLMVNCSRVPVICGNLNFLNLSSYGHIQRSEVAIVTDRPSPHDYFSFIGEVYNTANTRKIRIFSNGVCGKVEPA